VPKAVPGRLFPPVSGVRALAWTGVGVLLPEKEILRFKISQNRIFLLSLHVNIHELENGRKSNQREQLFGQQHPSA
jgi:hypothetical protein